MAKAGVDAATILDIVRAAGVSQPSFYNHFDSKEALAKAIATQFFQTDAEYKRRVFESVDDPAVAIAINCRHTLEVATRDPVVAWVLVHAGTTRNLFGSSNADALVTMIQRGIDAGRFRALNARTAALMTRGAGFPVLQDMLLGTASKQIEREFVLMVLQMLGLTQDDADKAYVLATEHLAHTQLKAE